MTRSFCLRAVAFPFGDMKTMFSSEPIIRIIELS